MKKGKTPQRRRLKPTIYSARHVAGTFAIRFDGFSMVDLGTGPIPYYLVGEGLIKLDGNGNLVGKQTSVTTPLAGTNAQLLLCTYDLAGTYVINSDGTGSAEIDFTPTSPGCATEHGTFSLVIAGPERFWLISTGATSSDGPPPDEVVHGEAVRISA